MPPSYSKHQIRSQIGTPLDLLATSTDSAFRRLVRVVICRGMDWIDELCALMYIRQYLGHAQVEHQLKTTAPYGNGGRRG